MADSVDHCDELARAARGRWMKLFALLPELVLGGLCLVLVPLAGFARGRARMVPGILAAAGLIAALVLTARMLPWAPVEAMEGAYAVDGFAHVFKLLILGGAFIALCALLPYFRDTAPSPHVPVALVFATLGAVGLTSSVDLALVLLFLQLMTMASYVLVAAVRTRRRAQEAGLKLFIYGAVALAVLGYGLTFFYGLGGTLDMRALGPALAASPSAWVGVGLALVLVGYGFEVTLVPFHPWAPDVYEGATAPVSGFVSVVPKIAGFAALIRFLVHVLPGGGASWPTVVAIGAALTMTLGNLAALGQERLKRLLAYSSIAQAGYVLMAVAVLERSDGALSAIVFYLAAYGFMNLGAFVVASIVERARGTDELGAFRGLARSHPWVAIVLVLSVLSLAGIPPLAGFVGKVLLLDAALDGGMGWLAVLGAANMVVGLYYYLRVAGAALRGSAPASQEPIRGYEPALSLSALGTLALGILPGAILQMVAHSSAWAR
jgi:NADH-quinone oxidoreductase subunit N